MAVGEQKREDTYNSDTSSGTQSCIIHVEASGAFQFAVDATRAGYPNHDGISSILIGWLRCCSSVMRFLNHSCNPNCQLVKVMTNANGYPRCLFGGSVMFHCHVLCVCRLGFYTMTRIAEGEGLTFCYEKITGKIKQESAKSRCLCGATNCRKFL